MLALCIVLVWNHVTLFAVFYNTLVILASLYTQNVFIVLYQEYVELKYIEIGRKMKCVELGSSSVASLISKTLVHRKAVA